MVDYFSLGSATPTLAILGPSTQTDTAAIPSTATVTQVYNTNLLALNSTSTVMPEFNTTRLLAPEPSAQTALFSLDAIASVEASTDSNLPGATPKGGFTVPDSNTAIQLSATSSATTDSNALSGLSINQLSTSGLINIDPDTLNIDLSALTSLEAVNGPALFTSAPAPVSKKQ